MTGAITAGRYKPSKSDLDGGRVVAYNNNSLSFQEIAYRVNCNSYILMQIY